MVDMVAPAHPCARDIPYFLYINVHPTEVQDIGFIYLHSRHNNHAMVPGPIMPRILIHCGVCQLPIVMSMPKIILSKWAVATRLNTVIASFTPVFIMASLIVLIPSIHRSH